MEHKKYRTRTEKNQKQKKILATKNTMVKSTMWLTLGNFISRFLGAAYVIPWYLWMGTHGNEAQYLFSKGYNIYALFLMISTAGLPAAVAKQTARFNSTHDYSSSSKLLKDSTILMGILGIFFFIVMHSLSSLLSQGNKDLESVIKSLSFVMIIFPVMSIIRGYFQGTNNFKPYALSQVIEQIIRVLFMLLGTYYIMNVGSSNYKTAVIFSTFCAFLGAIAALILLLIYLKKDYGDKIHFTKSKIPSKLSSVELIRGMVVQAIPFIFIGSGISIFKIIDQYTFEFIMLKVSNFSIEYIKNLFTLLSPNPDKIVMMIISIGTAMATAGLPLVTEKYNKREVIQLRDLVSNNFNLFFYIMIPAISGAIVLSSPLNTLFYKYDILGTHLLAANCILSLFMGLFLVSSVMLQGLDGNIFSVISLVLGLTIKILTQYPLIYFFHEYGPIVSTIIGFVATNSMIVYKIYSKTKFNIAEVSKTLVKIILVSLLMSLILLVIGNFINLLSFTDNSKFCSLINILLLSTIGSVLYFIFSKITGLLSIVTQVD